MRILYHHRVASCDGQAVHIEEMIGALRSLGHEVRVVAPSFGKTPGLRGQMGSENKWIKYIKVATPRAVYELLELAYSLVAYRQLRQAVEVFQPDFIYERYNLFLMAGLMLKKRMGIPMVLEVNSPLVYERSFHSGGLSLKRLAEWSEGTVWRGADVVLPVTRVLAEHVMGRGVASRRISAIPNGINATSFSSAPSPDVAKATLGLQGKLVLGFTGFVREWHGMDRVLDWMAVPRTPSKTHLLVVGDGPVREQLERQARRLGLNERITFTGVVHRDQVSSYVAAFDIALQPAVTPYASPLKLMEYLVMGKAIVAPDAPNLKEILSNGINALLFDHTRGGSFEEVLTALCVDQDLRFRLAREAKETINKLDLTWLGNARRVVSLVESLR